MLTIHVTHVNSAPGQIAQEQTTFYKLDRDGGHIKNVTIRTLADTKADGRSIAMMVLNVNKLDEL